MRIKHTCPADLVIQVGLPARGRYSTFWTHGGSCAVDDINQTFRIADYFDGEFVNQQWVLIVLDNVAVDSGYIDGWDVKPYYCPPTLEGVEPASGESCAGATQLFTTTIADCVNNVSVVEYHFDNGGLNKVNSIYLRYDRRHDQIYLRDAANTTWLGGYALGADEVIDNGFGRLHVRDTSAEWNSGQLLVHWAIEFLPAYAGRTYNQLLYASNQDGQADGWEGLGAWTVSQCAAQDAHPNGRVFPDPHADGHRDRLADADSHGDAHPPPRQRKRSRRGSSASCCTRAGTGSPSMSSPPRRAAIAPACAALLTLPSTLAS